MMSTMSMRTLPVKTYNTVVLFSCMVAKSLVLISMFLVCLSWMTIHISSLQQIRGHGEQATLTEAESHPAAGDDNSWITAESEGAPNATPILQRARRSLLRSSSNRSSRVKRSSDCGTPYNEPEHVRREHHGKIVRKNLAYCCWWKNQCKVFSQGYSSMFI